MHQEKEDELGIDLGIEDELGIVLAAACPSVCQIHFFHFSYTAENTLSPSAWMKIQRTSQSLQQIQSPKISRRDINASSGLDMVLLVLRL